MELRKNEAIRLINVCKLKELEKDFQSIKNNISSKST